MKPGVTEELPFGPSTLVYKVMRKVFALTGLEEFKSVNLKCSPDKAIELRERYVEVQPGYHMNKKRWNTVTVNGAVGDQMIYDMIDHSYELIKQSLTKKLREELENR